MVYASVQDMNNRFGELLIKQLADRDSSGVADQLFLQQVLDAATGEVDLALAGKYAIPLSVVPSVIKETVLNLAFAKLFAGGTLPEDTENAAKDARTTLKMIAEGKYTLIGIPRAIVAQRKSGGAFVGASSPTELSDRQLQGFGQ